MCGDSLAGYQQVILEKDTKQTNLPLFASVGKAVLFFWLQNKVKTKRKERNLDYGFEDGMQNKCKWKILCPVAMNH